MMTIRRDNEYWLKCLMTLTVVIFAYLRRPEMLLEPRFWAEEGNSYFPFAYNNSFIDNMISAQYGYYTLYNSIATSLAQLVSLEYAPYVTTYLAFLVQVSVSAVVIWWDIPILNSLLKKFIVALSIQYLAYARLWVTTIGVQYWLCVLTFLILLHADTKHRKLISWQNLILVHNGLTGVLSCFMIPAFALKAYSQRSWALAAKTAILIGCLMVQVGTFVRAMVSTMLQDNGQMSQRLVHCDSIYMLVKLVRHQFTVPFFGHFFFDMPSFDRVEDYFHLIDSKLLGNSLINYNLVEFMAGLLLLLFVVMLFRVNYKSIDTKVILVSLVLVTVFSTLFSVNMSGGPRYTFAPSVMILLFVVSAMNNRSTPFLLRSMATVLVICSVCFSLYEFRPVMEKTAYSPSWPKWRDELSRWRQDNSYRLKIWPPGWTMELRGKHE